MPVVALAPLHVLLVAKLFHESILSTNPRLRLIPPILIIAGGVWCGSTSFTNHCRMLNKSAASQLEADTTLTMLLKEKPSSGEYVPVYYYRASSPAYALHFGSGFARHYFSKSLAPLYPNAWFFNVFNARFESFAEALTAEEFYPEHPNPIFFGSGTIESLPFNLVFPLPEGRTLARIWSNGPVFIHRLTY